MTGGPARASAVAAIAVDGGDLPLGGGLLALVRPALGALAPGGVLAVLSSSRSVREDLDSWCRLERHQYLGLERDEPAGRDRHLIVRGPYSVPRMFDPPASPLTAREGARLTSAEVLAASPMPARADKLTGFAPRGARVEPGGPAYPFTLLDRDRVAPPEVAQLYDQAVAAPWDPSRDIPWHKAAGLAPALEAAVGQVMTFLAENELSALYVPARFLPRVHPAFVEVAMFLATQLADEARHIDAFMKRARAAGGAPGVSSVTTSYSLHSLLESADFTEASFLLSVLGEGTFLDLLRFVEEHAPDEATREVARRARADEARHVHFGMAHVRHALAHDPGLYGRLEAAVRRRAALMASATVPAPLQDALTVMAAKGTDPAGVRRGHEAFRELVEQMGEARVKRLVAAGFSAEQAVVLSELHTPNFM